MTEASRAVLARAGAILRALGDHEPDGASTTQLGRAAGVPRATAHRLLVTLAADGLADRDESTGRWSLGPELYLLGLRAARRYDVADVARPFVEQLSLDTGESAFFSTRRGDETVCLVRRDGSFPLRSHVLHEGIRFPLGVASAGLVILSHLDDRQVREYLERVDLVEQWGESHTVEALSERIARTREAGYATHPGLVVEGSWGMGAAVFDGDGRPEWALSLTGVEQRFGADRRAALGDALLRHAHRLTEALGRTGR